MRFYPRVEDIPYECMILTEIGMVDLDGYIMSRAGRAKLETMTRGATARPKDWESKEAARVWFSKRFPYKTWKPRALDLFMVRMSGSSNV